MSSYYLNEVGMGATSDRYQGMHFFNQLLFLIIIKWHIPKTKARQHKTMLYVWQCVCGSVCGCVCGDVWLRLWLWRSKLRQWLQICHLSLLLWQLVWLCSCGYGSGGCDCVVVTVRLLVRLNLLRLCCVSCWAACLSHDTSSGHCAAIPTPTHWPHASALSASYHLAKRVLPERFWIRKNRIWYFTQFGDRVSKSNHTVLNNLHRFPPLHTMVCRFN